MTTMKRNYAAAERLTRQRLRLMLTENTGRALCDSGDHYGRHWQRNQGRNFEAEPSGTVSAHVYTVKGEQRMDLSCTLNVYHWLAERLTYNVQGQRKFKRWQRGKDRDGQLESIESFVDTLPDAQGIYSDGKPVTVNTYNGEDNLSQTLQYVYWEDADGPHVILQIHGGCDVRGGYTDGVFFDCTGNSELAIFDNARLTLACPRGCVTWDTYDGSRFEEAGNHWPAPAIDLDDLEVVTDRPEYHLYADGQQTLLDIEAHDRRGANTGKLWISEDDHKPHCPCCGEVLEVYSL